MKKEESLKRLEQMTAEDYIKVFEKMGSQRAEEDNLHSVIKSDLEHYGIS